MSMRRTSSTLTQQGNMLHFELSFSMVCAKKKKKKSTYSLGTILTSVCIRCLFVLSYKESKQLV